MLKSNPKTIRTFFSKSINFFFVIIFYSSSVRKSIIISKFGKNGCSSLAANIILVTDNKTVYFGGKFYAPTQFIYLSNIEVATKRVSFLYYFISCNSKILLIP